MIQCESDAFVLYDLASANGTFLNDQRILAPERLKEGDRVRVGSTVLTFRTRPTGGTVKAARVPAQPSAVGGTDLLPEGFVPPKVEQQVAATLEKPVGATRVLPQELPWLMVTEGPHAGLSAGLVPGTLLVRVGESGLTIRDLGSTNGTTLNGTRITGEVPLKIGATTISVVKERPSHDRKAPHNECGVFLCNFVIENI